MNDTEQLFVAAAVWALIAAAIARFIPNWPGRIAFFALAVGIPFWELPYGYYNFQKLCHAEVNLKVIEKLPPQDSVCIEYFDLGLYRQLVQAGFTRIEITGRSDNAKEYVASGRVFLTNHEQAESSYCIAFKNNISLPWRVLRADTLIERARDKRGVARQSEFYWAGMWWQEQAKPVLGRGGVCSKESNDAIAALRRGSE
jgi:hypothetical protein